MECTALARFWHFVLSSWYCWTNFLLWCVLIRYYAWPVLKRQDNGFLHVFHLTFPPFECLVSSLGSLPFCTFAGATVEKGDQYEQFWYVYCQRHSVSCFYKWPRDRPLRTDGARYAVQRVRKLAQALYRARAICAFIALGAS